MGHHENIADQRAFDEQAGGADQDQLANFIRVARGDFGSDPAADALQQPDLAPVDFEGEGQSGFGVDEL